MAVNGTIPSTPGEFWTAYGNDIEGMAVIAIGIIVYGLLVNAFYQGISKRIMFSGKKIGNKVSEGGFGRSMLYLMMFPLVSFLFFILLSAALMFLSDAGQAPITVFTLAMAIVLAVRVAAYFNEATSHDVAKMLPLGLLGVFLVEFDFTGFRTALDQMLTIFDHLDVVAAYFLIVVLVEYVLRIIYLLVKAARGGRKPPERPRLTGPPKAAADRPKVPQHGGPMPPTRPPDQP